VINPQEFAGFGNYAGFGRPGNRGTYIGFKAGWSTTSRAGDGNVVLGAEAASNTTISDSIVIGNDAMSELGTTQSGVLWLHYNNGATPGIAGKFASGYFGINTTPANLGAAWDVQAYESGDKVFRYKKPGGSSMWEGLPDGSLWIGTVPDTAAAGDNQILMRDPTTGEIVKKLESAVVNAARGNNSISFIIGDGIAVITTGVALDFVWPCNATITGWQIVSTLTGSVVLDVWKDSYANFPPVVGDTIAGSEKPTLSSAVKNQDLTLSSFSTSVTAQDNWRLNVDSASTLKRITVTFFFNKTS
ncbi:MAG: hypothetical protein ABI002_09975, partial [Saprospiraceae bacterium]